VTARQRFRGVAFHEAGHIVTARHEGLLIEAAVLDSRNEGLTTWRWPASTPHHAQVSRRGREREVRVALAGMLAQAAGFPKSTRRHHARPDIDAVCDLLLPSTGGDLASFEEAIARLTREVVRFLRRPHVWEQVAAVAGALMSHRQLSGKALYRIATAAERMAKPDEMPRRARKRTRGVAHHPNPVRSVK
jgi:hypothetical protein